MTSGAVSVGMAAAAPLVVLFGIRGALLAAGVASMAAAVVARGLGLNRLRGESDGVGTTLDDNATLAPAALGAEGTA
jgi:hypothetical protein